MQNKPFITLFLSAFLFLGNEIDVEGRFNFNEDLFPCIPNSSADSRSNESTGPR